jgi:hypothetical protein
MTTRTHLVQNPTASTITVGANSVSAHTTATLTLSDADSEGFTAAGCSLSQITPGTASADQLRGYIHE